MSVDPNDIAAVEADPAAVDLKAIKNRRPKYGDAHVEHMSGDVDDLIAAVEALRKKADNAWNEAWDLAHEPARCGHVRANYKDPKFGTPEYKGNEKCEACAAVEALRKRVAELTGERDLWAKLAGEEFHGEHAMWGKVHAAEARVAELEPIVKDGVRRAENCMNWQSYAVELAGALEKASQFLDEGMGLKAYKLLKETAAATPEEVMERAKIQRALIEVSDVVIGSGRRLRSDPGSHELALANLCAVMGELARLDALKEGG